MTPHFIAHIFHILESIEVIQEYTHNGQIGQDSRIIYDAVLRNLQTLSESAHKLPTDIKAQHPEVRWRELNQSRNALVHDYLGDIAVEEVWRIIVNDLPILFQAMLEHVPNWNEIKKEYRDKPS